MVDERDALLSAIPRSLPAWTCESTDCSGSNIMLICAPSKSVTAGAQDVAKQAGIQVVDVQQFASGATDVSAALTCARARARMLPHLAHLQGNRSASESVSPAQGGET